MEFLKQFIRVVLPAKALTRIRHARDVLFVTHHYYERSGRQELMRKAFTALAFNGIPGDYLEFGSWGGMTFALAYRESRRANFRCKLWSFDSFAGLPPQASPEDEHRAWVEGTMSTSLEEFRAICQQNGVSDDD
jgi:Macrocin-O-methyltransferase (TylF)